MELSNILTRYKTVMPISKLQDKLLFYPIRYKTRNLEVIKFLIYITPVSIIIALLVSLYEYIALRREKRKRNLLIQKG